MKTIKENREALNSYSRMVDENGSVTDDLRRFWLFNIYELLLSLSFNVSMYFINS